MWGSPKYMILYKQETQILFHLCALGLSYGMWNLVHSPGIKPGLPALGAWILKN